MLYNIQNALLSIWSNKVRSILTVLGVIIGVASVAILVSLGEGLKHDVSGLIEGFGTNVIAITGGKIDPKSATQSGSNPANFISGDVLTMSDVRSIQAIDGVELVAPAGIIPGSVKFEDKTATPTIFATYGNFLNILEVMKLKNGRMFDDNETNQQVIVLGKTAAATLFGDNNAIGKIVKIGTDEYTVIGTLESSAKSSVFGSEFDSFSLVPFSISTKLNKGTEKVLRIYVKANSTSNVENIKTLINSDLLVNHNGEEDFTILTQEDMLDLFSTFLNLATTMVSAIAAISLVVGGIGIMNIMLVTVTERTREIGLRKAVGATRLAILTQFLTEAIIITCVGAGLGLLISIIVGVIISAKTDLKPILTLNVIMIATGISVVIGIIFGLWPAMRAANKDPIEALRYE